MFSCWQLNMRGSNVELKRACHKESFAGWALVTFQSLYNGPEAGRSPALPAELLRGQPW